MKCRNPDCDNEADTNVGVCKDCYDNPIRIIQDSDLIDKLAANQLGEAFANSCKLSQNSDALEVVALLKQVLKTFPPCPECKQRNCLDWFKAYTHWLMAGVMARHGFMAMFISLLEKSGGDQIFLKEDLEAAQDVTKLEIYKSQDEDLPDAFRCVIAERRSDFSDKSILDQDKSHQDEEWPDTVLDNPFG